MTIKITSEEELKKVTVELLHVLTNLRHWQKEWNLHYGGTLLNQKKIWEKRADELLGRLKIEYGANRTVNSFKIEIQNAD